MYGIEMFGQRILPQVVDFYAQTDPSRVYAFIPNSNNDLSRGFSGVTMAKLAAMVNHLSWWLTGYLGCGALDAIAYIGPCDIRYCIIFLASVKCGYKMLFMSPRNRASQNHEMMRKSDCRALFYATEMSDAAANIQGRGASNFFLREIPCLKDLLRASSDVKLFPYEKQFDDVRDEPCLVLHSSGSTGDPKLITMTHGTFACTDNDRKIPTPEGREAQNASLFNFEGGGKFYSCFPPYHLAGVHAYIDLPIFSTSASVVFGPSDIPPSGWLVSEILKQQDVRAFYMPPFIIEQWASEPVAAEQAKNLDFMLYGGGPLSPSVGNNLEQVTKVCQMYGSLEMGQIQLLVPQAGEWSYMELNPFEEADMQPCGDGTFEMVLHQQPRFAGHRSLWHNFPTIPVWRTGDLFLPHPSKSGLWRFHGRLDDLIVLSSSHKLRPLEMETLIQSHPLLSGALIVGQGRPQPLLLVEPVSGAYENNIGQDKILDQIWSAIEQANAIAPKYAVIGRSMVLVTDPERPFVRAPKGTIVRKLTESLYSRDIESAYIDKPFSTRSDQSTRATCRLGLCPSILQAMKRYVRDTIEQQLQGVAISDTDNIFVSGLDSLGAAEISRGFRMDVKALKQRPGRPGRLLSLREVYANPTIEKLASMLYKVVIESPRLEYSGPTDVKMDADIMRGAVDEFTKNLPSRRLHRTQRTGNSSLQKSNVAIIGPRGSLGPNIVKELMDDPCVASVYCLSRGNESESRLRSIFKQRNFNYNKDGKPVYFMSITLGKPHLGLSQADLEEVLSKVDVVIHNAWRVNFSWTLDSYKGTYLQSVRELVELASLSIRDLRTVFISSISSVQDWATVFPDQLVTETPLQSWDVASPLGYGQSKHVAERILAASSKVSGVPVTILRIGQVAGPTDPRNGGGQWSTDEWIPSLAVISKTLGLVPTDIPPIDWIPVDQAAKAVVELASQSYEVNEQNLLRVFNVVNPRLSEWSIFSSALQSRLCKDRCSPVTLQHWVDTLESTDLRTVSEAEAESSTKILPFFQHLAETASRGVPLQPRFHTSEAESKSETMRHMRRIDEDLVNKWLTQWGL